ncbi:conjugal transfer protein [Kineobactrum sediminis]|uniref:Conjugal transfer protein n=1 Tax=Kineobactrum sediminis TaxID=1905677 RepID=A0A2N5Y4M9_9GAMM|nr:RAQPRD family integrative conjugative element protein [Kineobactrum sediminis]PLW83338.1 conjugal transfer protein [Kineobactrum sediminis]
MTSHRITTAALLGLAFIVPAALADTDAERATLARLLNELAQLEPLITSSEAEADPDARIQFQYDWLRQDLARVGAGIQAHLDGPRNEPRSAPPLRGDYRQ